MTEPANVAAARIEAERCKAALVDTARQLQQRLEPRRLAGETWEKAKNKGADLAEDAVDAVKRRPVATGGIIAALAMFLARDPIKDAARRAIDAMTSDDEEQDDKPAPPPARRRAKPPRRAARKTEKSA